MTSRSTYRFIFSFFVMGFMMVQPAQNFAAQVLPNQRMQGQSTRSIPSAEIDARMENVRLKEANKHRQAQIRVDTDKLLELSTELKAYVDKTNEGILSVDVIKKAEEIEKLAHSVREKMRNN